MLVMAKINDLIEKLCSNGIEYKPFGEMATIVRGASPRPIKKYVTDHVDGVNWIKIGDVKPGSKYITDVAEKITMEGAQKSRFVKEGDFILSNSMSFGRPYIMKTQGCIHDGWLSISNFSNYYIPDFLYYLLSSNKYQDIMKQKASFSGAVQNLNADIVRELPMPIVPLEVQQEIVRILDQFTQLITELTEKLTVELTARKQQYQYYRDKLLKREEYATQSCPLKNVCLSIADGDHMPPPKSDSGVPFITISNITENKSIDFSNVMYVPHAYYDKVADKRKARRGDILYTVVGSFGTPVYISKDSEFVFQRHIAILRPDQNKINPRYMYYAMQSADFYRQADKAAKGAAQRTIGLASLGNMQIILPPIEKQRRIVSILDRFDALCNDLTSGLPAEIAARQRQYEYYRDKLLTFPERKEADP